MKVSLITDEEGWHEWDQFVKAHPKSSLYHALEWKDIMEATFGYDARFLVARSDAGIIDILPLYLVSLLGIWKKLVCIPMSGSYAAFLSENSGAHSLLIEAATVLARKEGVQYLEIRNNAPHEALLSHNFIERRPFYFSQIEIRDVETNKKLLSQRHRRSIAKGGKMGLSVVTSRDKADLGMLYAVMEEMYREFGTPIFSYSYLENMWETLMPHGLFVLFIIRHNGKVVGGGCNYVFRDKMIYKYGAYRPSARPLCPTHALIWGAIEECSRRRLRFFDLGATSAGDHGLRQFKNSFGAAENPGFFYYLPIKGKPPAMEAYHDSYQFIKKIWQHLPKPLLRIIGPHFYKWIC